MIREPEVRGIRAWVKRLLAGDQTSHDRPAALALVSPWTEADRQNLQHFFSSGTGVKLSQRLRATEAHNAIAGAADVLHTSHSAGRSQGYGDCLKHLASLARSSDKPEQKLEVVGLDDDLPKSVDDLIERMRP